MKQDTLLPNWEQEWKVKSAGCGRVVAWMECNFANEDQSMMFGWTIVP